MNKILILTEGGGGIGYGHVTRCSAIAQALGEGSSIVLDSLNTMPIDVDAKFANWIKNPSLVLDINGGMWPNLILIDAYNADYECINFLKNSVNFLAVIDDYNRMVYPCDLIINPSVTGPDYAHQYSKIVSGPEYVILRQDICESVPKRYHGELINLLVTFGGGVNSHLLSSILPMLCELNLSINILTGDDNKASYLRSILQRDNFKIFGHLNPLEISQLFLKTDLAISAGGQTLNELAFLGVPFIAVETGEDQYWNIEGYVHASVTGKHFYSSHQYLAELLYAEIARMENSLLRSEVSQSGRDLIDGLGACRIARLLKYYAHID